MPFRSTVLADGVDSRVECITVRDGRVLRKTYTSSPFLVWRSVLRRSRSQREYENLKALAVHGIPVVEPLGWSEERSLGCVVTCAIVTRFVEAQDLGVMLRSGSTWGERRAWARRVGGLLQCLHAAGLSSTTASPRNVLVTRSGVDAELRLCDQPFVSRVGIGSWGRWFQDVDLFDAFFSPSRLREWSTTERWRGVLSYCGGDVTMARRTWGRLSSRRRSRFRVAREVSRFFSHLRKCSNQS